MRFLRRLIAWLLSPFRRRQHPAPRRRVEPSEPSWKTAVGEDFPDVLEEHVLYLVGEDGEHWFAAMLCPCECGDSIQLSLLPNDYPSWRFHLERDATPTLSPSVWRKKGCRSHFHLRRGAVQWCAAESRGDASNRDMAPRSP